MLRSCHCCIWNAGASSLLDAWECCKHTFLRTTICEIFRRGNIRDIQRHIVYRHWPWPSFWYGAWKRSGMSPLVWLTIVVQLLNTFRKAGSKWYRVWVSDDRSNTTPPVCWCEHRWYFSAGPKNRPVFGLNASLSLSGGALIFKRSSFWYAV